MEAQLVDDLVHRLAFSAKRDSDQVEILRWDISDGGAVGLVGIGREELMRIDGRC